MAPKGKTMKTVVELAGAIDPSLGRSVNEASDLLGKIDLKAAAIGATFIAAGVMAVKGISDITKELWKLGEEFGDTFDNIRIQTGATGEALEALKDDFKAVYTSVPADMDKVGTVIADFNTKLDLSGDVLQNVSEKALLVSDLMKEDVTAVVDESSKAFKQWNIDAEDMGGQMDYIFKVSQSTGAGFTDLLGKMQQYGPQLQGMGYGFQTAATLMGQLEKEGVNTDEILGALKKSTAAFAKENLSAGDGLAIYYAKIKKARTETEAINIAAKVFGTKAGSSMARAIREGSLNIQDLTKSLQESGETIKDAAWDIYDAPEKWKLFQNKMQVMFEPIATVISEGLGDLMDSVAPAFAEIMPVWEDFLKNAAPVIKSVIDGLGKELAKIMPPLLKLGTEILPLLVATGKLLGPVFAFFGGVLTGIIEEALNAFTPLITNIIDILTNLIDFVRNVFSGEWSAAWDNIKDIFSNLGLGILNTFGAIINSISGMINSFINGINTGLPEWMNIPKIPMIDFNPEMPKLAAGGWTDGPSIAGEAGREAVISFDPAYREKNLSLWEQAGQLLGADNSVSTSYDLGGFTFSPQLIIEGDVSPQSIIEKLKECESDFVDLIMEWLRSKGVNFDGGDSLIY